MFAALPSIRINCCCTADRSGSNARHTTSAAHAVAPISHRIRIRTRIVLTRNFARHVGGGEGQHASLGFGRQATHENVYTLIHTDMKTLTLPLRRTIRVSSTRHPRTATHYTILTYRLDLWLRYNKMQQGVYV